MERPNLIDYASSAAIAEKKKALKADGFKLERSYDLTREQGAFNAKVGELSAAGIAYKTLIEGAVRGEIYVKDSRRSGRVVSDVDWDEPISDIRGRVEKVLR